VQSEVSHEGHQLILFTYQCKATVRLHNSVGRHKNKYEKIQCLKLLCPVFWGSRLQRPLLSMPRWRSLLSVETAVEFCGAVERLASILLYVWQCQLRKCTRSVERRRDVIVHVIVVDVIVVVIIIFRLRRQCVDVGW